MAILVDADEDNQRDRHLPREEVGVETDATDEADTFDAEQRLQHRPESVVHFGQDREDLGRQLAEQDDKTGV